MVSEKIDITQDTFLVGIGLGCAVGSGVIGLLAGEAYLTGHRVAVWELLAVHEETKSVEKTASHFRWPRVLVKRALAYAKAFPDEIRTALGEDLVSVTPGSANVFHAVTNDSRIALPGQLFVALRTDERDGHARNDAIRIAHHPADPARKRLSYDSRGEREGEKYCACQTKFRRGPHTGSSS